MLLISLATILIDLFTMLLQTPKEECYLPEASSELVHTTPAKMRFYTTNERWFGMTYQEDREQVKQEILKKIQQRIYPEKLWK